MNFLSLFSGVGGMDLGLERAGMRCVAQVEIDPAALETLSRQWPDVPKYSNVKEISRATIGGFHIDLVAGGFPCTDISNAGGRDGIEGADSRLWQEMFRVVCEIRPRFVLVENVAALLARGIDRVLGDLASRGFDAEWDCIPAAAFGAPYLRDRVFILAHDPKHGRATGRAWRPLGDAPGLRQPPRRQAPDGVPGGGWWATEPCMGRLVHGLPPAVDAIRGLGNVVVPQVAEWLGRRLMESAA